jgi:nifR3 family TIM-barrel protein
MQMLKNEKTLFWERVEKRKLEIQAQFQNENKIKIGPLSLSSPLVMAPLAGITDLSFRLLMQDLGAAAGVTELISANGLHYKSEKTLQMIDVDKRGREKVVGVQFFGEVPEHMAEAALIAIDRGASFVDVNMGCPVKKVVSKGAGSAMMRKPQELYRFLEPMRKACNIPLSIKIRTGWSKTELTALDVVKVAADLGIDFIALHGRTRDQHYAGFADWDYIEKVAKESKENYNLDIIGNGDLHTPELLRDRLGHTGCAALMLGRGPLRFPFLFLDGLTDSNSHIHWSPLDHLFVLERYKDYVQEFIESEQIQKVQIRKISAWMAAGFPRASLFRGNIFKYDDINEIWNWIEEYFHSLPPSTIKKIAMETPFMNGGHG